MTFGTQSGIVNAPSPRPVSLGDANTVRGQSLASPAQPTTVCQVALLTGGGDRPYALGLASALISQGLFLDFIGSDDVDSPELHSTPNVHFLNLRGCQQSKASPVTKALRVLRYYAKLVKYAAVAKPRIFHVLWNNKFELFDRTVLMLYYRLLGKKVVFTAHNVNAGVRDSNDTWLNRLSLKIQYRLCDHIFVHTIGMRSEMLVNFNVPERKASVIPFGINNTAPNTGLTPSQARRKLDLDGDQKIMLFFGHIAPYKGLEFLIEAFEVAAKADDKLRLVVAGRPKGSEDYWRRVLEKINRSSARAKITLKIEYVPDAETELYFKAAHVLVLPYTHIFQSGVLVLAYNFGLPVIAADVGSLREEIIEGKTGFVFQARDPLALERTIEAYFASDLFKNLENRRREIREYANERYSWNKVAAITTKVYSRLLEN